MFVHPKTAIFLYNKSVNLYFFQPPEKRQNVRDKHKQKDPVCPSMIIITQPMKVIIELLHILSGENNN